MLTIKRASTTNTRALTQRDRKMKTHSAAFWIAALFLLHLSSFSDAPPSSSRATPNLIISHLSRSLHLLVRPLHLRQNLRHGHPQLLKHLQRHLERLSSFSRRRYSVFFFVVVFFPARRKTLIIALRFQTHQNRRSQNFLRLRRGQGHVDSPAAIDEERDVVIVFATTMIFAPVVALRRRRRRISRGGHF